MKRRDHVTLGRFIWQFSPVKDHPILRQAFMIGCVEPDTNVFTYLRGSMKYHNIRGHNKENAESHILRQLEKNEFKCIMNAWNCFALGATLHYLSDSFTYAHNNAFGDDLHEHRRYEWKLHYALDNYLNSDEISVMVMPDIKNAKDFWITSHGNYIQDRSGYEDYETDCRYIVNVCMAVFQYAFATAAVNAAVKAGSLKNERIMGLYENTDNNRLVFARD